MKKKIIISVLLIAVVVIGVSWILINKNMAKVEMYVSTEFPESYKPYIKELEKKFPNWEFKALYTNLDWEYVIDNENVFGKNLVPKSYSDSWKNTNLGEYNVEVDSGWVDASRAAVEFAIDPRNFINSVRVFQFEELSYNSKTNTKASIEKILYGTEFYDTTVEYLNSSGKNIVTDKKYSDLILEAAKESDVSAFHLASRIKQEVGPFLSHKSISGDVEGYEGLYNFYNIGATSSSEAMGAIKNGLQYAKDGKGASTETKNKYLIPWNTKAKSITGGAIFIGSSYINKGQNTIYLQKFHVSDSDDGELFWHQYMTNVLAPYSESKIIYNGYNSSDLLDSSMSFIIPIYENMPELPALSPAISEDDFTDDNSKVFANVQTTLNVRTGPGTSYEVLTSIQSGEEMTRIAKGKQNGELWDRVKLQNGMVGFVFQEYVEEVPEDFNFTVDGNYITGLKNKNNTVDSILKKISINYDIEIYNKNNEKIEGESLVGTGSKLKILNEGSLVSEYEFILFGDVNGDGKINSVDLLVLQRHILSIQILDEAYVKAGNVRKNNKNPSSVDCLLIQRHILNLEKLEQ